MNVTLEDQGELVPTIEVAEAAGVSVRALDHWARCGVYAASGCEGVGSGHRRAWTPEDIRIVKVLKCLTDLNCPLRTMAIAAEALTAAVLKDGDTRWLLVNADEAEVVPASRLGETTRRLGATWVVSLGTALA